MAEWTIVELQGDIECKSHDDALNGKFIGDLHFTKKVIFELFRTWSRVNSVLIRSDTDSKEWNTRLIWAYMQNEGRQENKKCEVWNYGWDGTTGKTLTWSGQTTLGNGANNKL